MISFLLFLLGFIFGTVFSCIYFMLCYIRLSYIAELKKASETVELSGFHQNKAPSKPYPINEDVIHGSWN